MTAGDRVFINGGKGGIQIAKAMNDGAGGRNNPAAWRMEQQVSDVCY